MPKLPVVAWVAVAAVALLLLALCAVTAWAVLRAPSRRRVAAWPAWRVVALVVGAAAPWVVVRLAPIHIEVAISGIGALIGWLLIGLLVFALLVLLPLAALSSCVVWCVARVRRGGAVPPAG